MLEMECFYKCAYLVLVWIAEESYIYLSGSLQKQSSSPYSSSTNEFIDTVPDGIAHITWSTATAAMCSIRADATGVVVHIVQGLLIG